MEGLLFDSAFDAGPRANTGCSSVNDLQQRLHASLAAKSSDTRCEHVDMTFELRHSTVFDLTADAEANAPDESDPMHQISQQLVTRTVTALETTQEQPSDDPVLQKAVAKFIIARIGLADGSSWAVREISRGVQGWTFTYLCKQSLQFWNRANAKNSDRPPIANYSMNLPFDHINLSRPAFDCRGTVTIAFTKSTRAILVKYGHTPLHKTVADLVELYPIRLPPTPTAPNARTPKAKRPPPAEGEEGSRRKKAKKKPADPPGQGEGAEPVPGETTEAGESAAQTPATGEQGAKKKRPRKKSTKATPAQAQEPAAQVEPPAGDQQPDTVQAAPTESPHEETPASQTGPTAVNLRIPPAEAERRKQHANNMLRSKDIDPATLSVEQFNIFANQAPTLQEASLEMLAKYGAERLRIVHPDNGGSGGSGGAEQAASKNSTPGQSQMANPTPSATADPSASQTPAPVAREAQPAQDPERPGVSIGDGAVVSMQQNGDVGTTESTLLPNGRKRKTRGSCENCKANKAKCTKEHPACSVCQQKGEQCFYAPPKPRKKSINPQGGDQEATQTEGSLAANGGDETGQGLGTFSTPQEKPSRRKPKKPKAADPPGPPPTELEQESPVVPVSESQQYDNSSAFSASHRPSVDAREHRADPQPAAAPESDNEEFYPDPNILNHHHSDNQVFNSHNHHPGLSFLHHEPTQAQPHAPTGQPDLRETANTTGHELSPSHPTQSNPVPEPSFTDQSPYQQAHHNPVHRHQTAESRPSPRPQNAMSSPKGQRKKSTGARHSLPTKQVSVASPAPVPSVQPMQQQSAQSTPQHGHRPPAQQPVPPPAQPTVQEPTHQSVQPTVQHLIQQPTQPPVRRSPHQAKAVTAHAQSRQGHRSQNTTPVTQTPLAQPPSQPPNVSYNATNTYDPFSRYDQGHSQFPTSTANEQGNSRMNYDTNASYTPTTSSKGTTNSPAYDFQRTRNPLNPALDTSGGYGSQRNSSRGQWSVSQAGGTQASSNSPYTMASASASGSTGAAESYGGQARNQSATSYQPQPQPRQSAYGNSYGTTQSQPHQATTSHGTHPYYGYGQDQATPSGGSSNSGGVMNQGGFHGQSRGYGMPPSADPGPYQPHRSPNVPQANTYGGHSYGSTDEQGIYELLRASGTGHQ